MTIMKPIIEVISFYPFSYSPLPKEGMFAIRRYNIIKHRWIVIEKRFGLESDIADFVHGLNEDAGIIREEFIVGYRE